VPTCTYNAADRITSIGSTSYTYDNNGNLSARGSDSFSWDAADRLTSATVGSTTTTFAYNPSASLRAGSDGLRDSFTTGGNTTTTTWDPSAELRAGSAGGLPQELYDGALSYVEACPERSRRSLGRISEVDGSGTTYYYLADPQGSVMALCGAAGNALDGYNYDDYGSVR
jgi:hypothetical protein